MIKATVIKDSINPSGERLTSFALRYPRIIHSEFMTHRMLSRSASSSRATPVQSSIDEITKSPFVPSFWGKNQKGMQAVEELEGQEREMAARVWLSARDQALSHVGQMAVWNVHKQIANRILEPWAHISVIATATDWDNFYALRCHPAAQPEMRALAEAMLAAHNASEPVSVDWGLWHLPYVREGEDLQTIDDKIVSSIARCARVSYNKHDGTQSTLEEDQALFNRLLKEKPPHASPAEHPAQATPGRHANFNGWRQYRRLITGENTERFERLERKVYKPR